MNKYKANLFILVLVILSFPSYANAEPSINSVSSNPVHGSDIVIKGSDFGTKTLAPPTSFLDFEAGTINNTINESGWIIGKAESGSDPVYSNKEIRGQSSLSAKVPIGYFGQSYLRYNWTVPPANQTFYVTYWRKNVLGGIEASNYKALRLQTTSGKNIPEVMLAMAGGSSFGEVLNFYGTGTSKKYFPIYHGQWIREELYFFAGTRGNSDAEIKWWIHRNSPPEQINHNSDSGFNALIADRAEQFNKISIGKEWGGNNTPSDTNTVYLDDVYIDNTQARVEIADNAVWDNCMHREIQIPSAWSDASITFQVNQGSFSNGQTAYLFVVDADGNVNTNGYPIVIGGDGGGGPTAQITITSGDARTVAFSATASEGRTISAYIWDFGDGSTSTAATPKHTYASGGNKTVTLKATIDGTDVQVTKSIYVMNLRIVNQPA